MPCLSENLQVTLPATGCEELGLRPGDEVVVLRYRDQFNIRKQSPATAAGALKGTEVDERISEHESLMSNFE